MVMSFQIGLHTLFEEGRVFVRLFSFNIKRVLNLPWLKISGKPVGVVTEWRANMLGKYPFDLKITQLSIGPIDEYHEKMEGTKTDRLAFLHEFDEGYHVKFSFIRISWHTGSHKCLQPRAAF